LTHDGENEADIELTFNSNQCSYDYSWKSNRLVATIQKLSILLLYQDNDFLLNTVFRWSGPDVTHVINIVALKNASESDFVVTSDCISDPFVIASSRKKTIKPRTLNDIDMDETPTGRKKYRRRNEDEDDGESYDDLVCKPTRKTLRKNQIKKYKEETDYRSIAEKEAEKDAEINESANILLQLTNPSMAR